MVGEGEKREAIVFQDIDDVLLSDRLIAACEVFDDTTAPPVKIPFRGDPIAVALINRACLLCGARVVVSSSWLIEVGWRYTLDWLIRSGLDPAHLHEDPAVRLGPEGSKRDAIGDWLKQHPSIPLDRVVVVDDDPLLFSRPHPLRTRQVLVEGPDGLRLQDYRAVVQKLGKIKGRAP